MNNNDSLADGRHSGIVQTIFNSVLMLLYVYAHNVFHLIAE